MNARSEASRVLLIVLAGLYAGSVGAYNPKDDPNFVASATRPPADVARVASLTREFERLQPMSHMALQKGSPLAIPQPAPYAHGDPQVSSAPYSQPYYRAPGPYSNWHHSRNDTSTRMEWWRLLRFTRKH